MKNTSLFFLGLLMLASCSSSDKFDAYGNFEATEVIVSSEQNGKLLSFTIEEGQKLDKNQLVGMIDTSSLYLKYKQTITNRATIKKKIPNVLSQIDVLKAQKAILYKDQERIINLFKDGASTQKQLDDINGRINVIEKQIRSIQTQKDIILGEIENGNWQISQIKDQLNKCRIINTIKGVVLRKYAEEGEYTGIGKALYKIANLDFIILRVYVSGIQLANLKLGQEAVVYTDQNEAEKKSIKGEIIWISNQAEFTPKIIQTKEERVKLVYAIKIKLKNNGKLKIGMPAEVNFK